MGNVLLIDQKEEEEDQENNQHQQIFLTKQHNQKEEEEDQKNNQLQQTILMKIHQKEEGRPRKGTTSKTSTSKKQPKSALRYELEDDISEPLEFVNDARSIQQVRHYMQLIANLERRNYDPNNIDTFTTEFVFATTPSKPGNNDFND